MNFSNYYRITDLVVESDIPLSQRSFQDEDEFVTNKLPDEYREFDVITFNHGSALDSDAPNMIFTFILDGDTIIAYAIGNSEDPVGISKNDPNAIKGTGFVQAEGGMADKSINPLWKNVMDKDPEGKPTTLEITPPFK